MSTVVYDWIFGKFVEDKETQHRRMEKDFPIGSYVFFKEHNCPLKIFNYVWIESHQEWGLALSFEKKIKTVLTSSVVKANGKKCPHCSEWISNEE